MKTSLTIIGTTTKKFNVLTAIHQIKLGYVNAPLVLENFPHGYEDDISIDDLMNCFKLLAQSKEKHRNNSTFYIKK